MTAKRFKFLLTLVVMGGLYGGAYLTAQQAPVLIYGNNSGTLRPIKVSSDGSVATTGGSGGGGTGTILDGVDSNIIATVFDLTNSNPIATTIVDGSGTAITSFGGGTQYTQDAALTVATSVGTQAMGRASAAKPTDVSADNDAVMPWYLRSGAVAVNITAAGALIPGDATDGLKVQISGTALTELQALTNTLGSTTSGQSGILALCAVTTAAPTYTTAQSNVCSMQVDGSVRVAVTNGATGGTSQADNASFTDNTSSLTPVGGVAEIASPTACTEGKFCAGATTLNRALKVTLYGTDGTALNPSSDVISGATASTSGPQGMMLGGTTAPSAVTAGQAVRAWAGLNGQAAVMLVDSSGTVVTPSTDYLQDAALTVSTTTGGMTMGRASVAAPTAVTNDDDAVMAWYSRNGAQMTITAPSTTATLANISGATSSTTLIASNTARRGVICVNDSTATLYLKFGTTASTTSFTYKLAPGDTWELGQAIYIGIVTGIWDSATGSARCTELT